MEGRAKEEAENCGRRAVPLMVLQLCCNGQNPFGHVKSCMTKTVYQSLQIVREDRKTYETNLFLGAGLVTPCGGQ